MVAPTRKSALIITRCSRLGACRLRPSTIPFTSVEVVSIIHPQLKQPCDAHCSSPPLRYLHRAALRRTTQQSASRACRTYVSHSLCLSCSVHIAGCVEVVVCLVQAVGERQPNYLPQELVTAVMAALGMPAVSICFSAHRQCACLFAAHLRAAFRHLAAANTEPLRIQSFSDNLACRVVPSENTLNALPCTLKLFLTHLLLARSRR